MGESAWDRQDSNALRSHVCACWKLGRKVRINLSYRINVGTTVCQSFRISRHHRNAPRNCRINVFDSGASRIAEQTWAFHNPGHSDAQSSSVHGSVVDRGPFFQKSADLIGSAGTRAGPIRRGGERDRRVVRPSPIRFGRCNLPQLWNKIARIPRARNGPLVTPETAGRCC